MNFSDFELNELNAIMQLPEKSNRNCTVFVDNLHTSFLEFDTSYTLPSTSVFHVEFEAARDYLQALAEFIPEAINGCNILPYPRPKRDTGKIILMKEFSAGSGKYLYILQLYAAYLGGAKNGEIVTPAAQERTLSVKTNRIYYSQKIIPVFHVENSGGNITDFSTQKYDASDMMIYSGTDNPVKKTFSEFFDEVDYSETISHLREKWHINDETWKPGRIFSPVGIEFFTVAFRFLFPSQTRAISEFSGFYGLAESLFHERLDFIADHIHNYENWLKSHIPERKLSPSGNMVWQIEKKQDIT